jgi:glycosyltransferase involved in cell wall biosynthesis
MTELEKVFYERLPLQEEYGGTDKPVNKIQPLVSVVTVTYQHAAYIRKCLDSILMQETDFPYEIIVGEDGSTDGTREICIEYANLHPDKIRLFLRDRNLSHYIDEKGRDIILNGHFARIEARGKYVAFCEGDDYWVNKKKLQLQINNLIEYNNGLCVHPVFKGKIGTEIIGNKSRESQIIPSYLLRIGRKNSFHLSSIIIKKESIMPFPQWLLNAPTGDYYLQYLASRKGKICYLPYKMSVYRTNVPESWTHRNTKNRRMLYKLFQRHINTIITIIIYDTKNFNINLLAQLFKYFLLYIKYIILFIFNI